MKDLAIENHLLAVPDEAAAIEAANAWQAGAPPQGRPYEVGADTSGYAIGAIVGQCAEEGGKLKVLIYYTAHLAPHQTHWHSSSQELWGLLCSKREKNKQLGRIPAIFHTDHADLARLEDMGFERLEPKFLRWLQEISEGGSLLLYRPGTGNLHRGPDGLSRNPEGRDRLILAKDSEWVGFRERIRGIEKTIREGRADDEEGEAVEIEDVPPEDSDRSLTNKDSQLV